MSHQPTSSGDAFARVGAALQHVWPQVADASVGLSRGEMGLLLDECGSDYRPLVELLLDIGRTVRPVLAGGAPLPPAAWANLRAPLVHKLVSTRYLQPDVARWAVDVWGQALGIVTVVESPSLQTAHASSGALVAAAPGALSGQSTSPTGPRAPAAAARPATVTPQQVPAALRNVPSWAGGPVSFRTGQKPKQASLAALAHSGRMVVRSGTASGGAAGAGAGGPRFLPVERRAAMVLGALLIIVSGGLMNAFRNRPDVMLPVDAVGAGSGPPATPVISAPAGSPAPAAPAPMADAVVVPPDSLATPVVETARAGMSPPGLVMRERVRDAGVGGRYLVTQRVRDVSGTESCDAVAQALGAGRESEERVSHAPGAVQFSLVTRGVLGTLDSDGQFISEPRSGTTNNVNWQFRMRGRFGPEGFTGESVTHTDAILRWGKQQNCVVTAELTGRRLPD